MNIKFIAEEIGLDYEQALEYVGGDIGELKGKLMSLDKDSDFAKLEEAVEKEDPEEIATYAHKARKAFERVSLGKLAILAGRVEEARTGNGSYKELKAALTDDEYAAARHALPQKFQAQKRGDPFAGVHRALHEELRAGMTARVKGDDRGAERACADRAFFKFCLCVKIVYAPHCIHTEHCTAQGRGA